MKFQEKIKAIQLRKAGKSYGEIKKEICVSRSTLSLWLRDIELTPKQQFRLFVTLRQINAYKMAKLHQEKVAKKTEEIIMQAKEEARGMINDPLFPAGLMLYWAEGNKSDKLAKINFSNSDPVMISFMMRWFREICNVPEKKFRISLHIHSLHCRKNMLKYWAKITQVPVKQFYKIQIKPTSLKQRKNKLYNGTCAISVYNSDLFRKIKGWRLGFLEGIQAKSP